jgi:hypothetical protein
MNWVAGGKLIAAGAMIGNVNDSKSRELLIEIATTILGMEQSIDLL